MYFFIIVLFFLFIGFIVYLKQPSTRGKRGENKVGLVIGETIKNEQYVINDLIVNMTKYSNIKTFYRLVINDFYLRQLSKLESVFL